MKELEELLIYECVFVPSPPQKKTSSPPQFCDVINWFTILLV
jgi:hypothetical protein